MHEYVITDDVDYINICWSVVHCHSMICVITLFSIDRMERYVVRRWKLSFNNWQLLFCLITLIGIWRPVLSWQVRKMLDEKPCPVEVIWVHKVKVKRWSMLISKYKQCALCRSKVNGKVNVYEKNYKLNKKHKNIKCFITETKNLILNFTS